MLPLLPAAAFFAAAAAPPFPISASASATDPPAHSSITSHRSPRRDLLDLHAPTTPTTHPCDAAPRRAEASASAAERGCCGGAPFLFVFFG